MRLSRGFVYTVYALLVGFFVAQGAIASSVTSGIPTQLAGNPSLAQGFTTGGVILPICGTGAPSGAATNGNVVVGADNNLWCRINGAWVQVNSAGSTPTLGAVVNAGNTVNGTAASGRLTWTTGGTYAAGTTSEIVGPTDTGLFLTAGKPAGTASGQSITMTAGAATTTGAGGSFTAVGGAAAGTDQQSGTVSLDTGASTGAASPTTITIKGAPAVAGGASGSGSNSSVSLLSLTANQKAINGIQNLIFTNPNYSDSGVASSGTRRVLFLTPSYNFTNGSSNVADFEIDRVETSLGSGLHDFILCRAGAGGSTSEWELNNAGIVKTYNALATAALGHPVIVAQANITAQSANATITSYANGAADADFEVSAQMNVSASTTLATTLSVNYTDVQNSPRTMILPVTAENGTMVAAGAISGAGATRWETPLMHIRAKASTTITVLTSAGTFTGITYSASAAIRKVS